MSGFPLYLQHDSMDCGPTCLRMISKYYGKHVSLERLRASSQIGKDGVNLLGMCHAAESIGFRSKGVKISYEQLITDVPLPAILHWRQYHFVILYKVSKRRLYVADPAAGLLSYAREEFKPKWLSTVDEEGTGEGVVMLLEATAKFHNREDDEKISGGIRLRDMLGYITPYKKMLVQLVISLLIGSMLQLGLPFLTQSIVDVGINTHNIQFIFIILLGQLALLAGRLIVEFVRSWILLYISTRINISILTDFLIKLMNLPIGFFDSKHTGDILQRMSDHQRIESFLTGSSLNTMFSLFNLVVFSVILLHYNSSLFFVFAVASFIYAVWVLIFLGRRKVLDIKRFDAASREQGLTIQLIQGMQEIKLHGCEKQMRWDWEKWQARLFKINMRTLALTQWQQSGAFFINEGKNVLITFLAARAVINGEITLGAMLAIQYIIGQLNSPIEQLVTFMQSWQNANLSLDRLNEIHKLDDEEPDQESALALLPEIFNQRLIGGKGGSADVQRILPARKDRADPESYGIGEEEEVFPSIRLNNLWFTYAGAGNEPILRDINLTIPLGKTTAIVGTSGSGKTTLLKLLLKFYAPQKGDIRVGNTSFGNISHRAWRARCGVVMQDSFIFNDSIARNIAVGTERVDMAQLHLAVKVANIDDFIESLPLGFNTRIGMEGNGISEGQKQRLLIARAVYRDPQLILFDEATNSLDANNETTIIQNLESFFKGRTVVVVAHRLSTIKRADQIVVLNKGTISEIGTHQELISLRGEYFTLIKNQLELGS